jgi:hypothetical protein
MGSEWDIKKIDSTLFERACDYIHSLEDLEKDLSLQTFMSTDEIMHLSVSYYDFARDAMPKEIVEFVLGNLHIGFIMGRMACGDNPEHKLVLDIGE